VFVIVGLVRVSHPMLLPTGTTIVSQEPNVRGLEAQPCTRPTVAGRRCPREALILSGA